MEKEMEDERDEERNSVHKTENFGRSEKDRSIFLKTQGGLWGDSDRDGADTCDNLHLYIECIEDEKSLKNKLYIRYTQ